MNAWPPLAPLRAAGAGLASPRATITEAPMQFTLRFLHLAVVTLMFTALT